jgi:hypothetical protein
MNERAEAKEGAEKSAVAAGIAKGPGLNLLSQEVSDLESVAKIGARR